MNTIQQAGYPVIASVARQSKTPCANRKITGLPRWLRLLAMTGGTVNHENGTASYEDCHCERSAAIQNTLREPLSHWIAASALSPRNDDGVFRPCGTEFKNAVIARTAGPWQSSCAAGCNGNLWIAASALPPRNDDAGVLSNKLTNNLD
jgi:hypothetical protein